jgi:DNA repair exonuclease SbcCD ATPase subunit
MLDLKFQELQQRKGRAKELSEQVENLTEQLRIFKREVRLSEQAQQVLQIVAEMTQNQLSYEISTIVTLALESVFNTPYAFELEFVQRRGKTEADMFFVRNGERLSPLTSSGGGTVDVACFALRVALLKIAKGKYRNTLILDEPAKHLSTDLQEKFSQMVQQISKELSLQIIMVSHITDLIENADKIFRVKIKDGVSTVKEIENG